MTRNALPLAARHFHPGICPTHIVVERLSRFICALTFETACRDGGVAKYRYLHACSARTLNGTYALTFSGFTTRGPVPAAINNFTPVAGGGLVTFDGNGNVSASETVSVGGLISPVNVPGTYTVNSDCTGTFITTPNAQLNLVILRNGKEIQAVNTVPGNVILDNFIRR